MLIRSIAPVMLVFALCISAYGQNETTEQAVTNTFSNADLRWVPCPDFIPKGCEIAVLHGDPSKANADIFFKVPANFNIPRHTHTSAERMVLVSGTLHVTYDGQKTAVLKPGTYAYGPAKQPHKAYCAKGNPCVLFIAFELAVDAMPTANTPKD